MMGATQAIGNFTLSVATIGTMNTMIPGMVPAMSPKSRARLCAACWGEHASPRSCQACSAAATRYTPTDSNTSFQAMVVV